MIRIIRVTLMNDKNGVTDSKPIIYGNYSAKIVLKYGKDNNTICI